MEPIALWGLIFITTALVAYSIGVWGEFFQKTILPYHILFFWIGLVCDTLGTSLMVFMAEELVFDIHAVSGAVAILLMLFHAIWATRVQRSGTEDQKRIFHRYSIFVWLFWLIPYLYPSAAMV